MFCDLRIVTIRLINSLKMIIMTNQKYIIELDNYLLIIVLYMSITYLKF